MASDPSLHRPLPPLVPATTSLASSPLPSPSSPAAPPSSTSAAVAPTVRRSMPLRSVVTKLVDQWSRGYLQDAQAGDPSAMCIVGQMYQLGWGAVKPNRDEARRWLTAAASAGADGAADLLDRYFPPPSAIGTTVTRNGADDAELTEWWALQFPAAVHHHMPVIQHTNGAVCPLPSTSSAMPSSSSSSSSSPAVPSSSSSPVTLTSSSSSSSSRPNTRPPTAIPTPTPSSSSSPAVAPTDDMEDDAVISV